MSVRERAAEGRGGYRGLASDEIQYGVGFEFENRVVRETENSVS